MERPSWTALAAAEPRLAALERVVRRRIADEQSRSSEIIRDDDYGDPVARGFCANWVWYREDAGDISPRMTIVQLVGRRRRRHPVLGTGEAHDVAYQHLWELIPPCAHETRCRDRRGSDQ
jgi:hypothetical protein